jgi:hypothetical protein
LKVTKKLMAAAAILAALIGQADAAVSYLTEPGLDVDRAKKTVFNYIDLAPNSLRDAIGDVLIYAFKDQSTYKTKTAAHELKLSTKEVINTSPKFIAVSWFPATCGQPYKRRKRSISFFVDKMGKFNDEGRQHIVLHEMLHQLDGVTCVSRSKTFLDAYRRDVASAKAFRKTLSKDVAKAFDNDMGYFLNNPFEAFAEVGANLVKMSADKEYREAFFGIFQSTWLVTFNFLEQRRIAMEATMPSRASAEGSSFQKVN